MNTQHTPFVHLHNHTEYSFLDGAIKIKNLVAKAKSFGMPALAITDHGGMFGCIEFFTTCMKEGVKPVLGFEAYVAPQSRTDRNRSSGEENYHHLILLARDQQGYRNLMRLSSIGYLEGFYYKPRIDMEVLRQYGSGIIATSACVAGAIPRMLLDGKRDRAKQLAAEYLKIFGDGNFYFELQDHGLREEKESMGQLIDLGNEMGIPFIVANDAHYLEKEDASSHEILLCIQTQTTIDDPGRFRFNSDQIYFKSPEEMAVLFPSVEGAMANTVDIANRCNVDPIEKVKQIARPGCPAGYASEAEYLAALAKKGLAGKFAHVTQGIEERLAFELGVIIKMGFDGYFLAVRDFVLAAKDKGIMTGCRGSAAGSLVAYALGITDVDPIRFELLFERFLNPERVSMPDADIDFADRDREKVIEYVIGKYGAENVCQIINFGRMKAKMVVKDVARVMGIIPAEAQRLANMVTEKDLARSIETNSELARLIESDSKYKELFRHAKVLEGLVRQAGMHAAGVVIAPKPVVNWAPLFKQPGEGNHPVMTQYDMKYVEDAGLIKMDFLGLITLTILQDAIRYVRKNHGVSIDLWKLPDRDPKTYDLLGRGDTVAVFQFESQGMQDNLRKLKPDNIEDLIAMNALYRPGPIDQIPTYIHRKHGREPVDCQHDLLKDILGGTYGVFVYQEQVMRTSRIMGGFSMGQADNLRKAMSKKKMDEIDKMRQMFVEGAKSRSVDPGVADAIYTRMAKFGEYGFNKAHSTVYAHVAYQCAYLKANYPLEFMTANLSAVLSDAEELLKIKSEAERMGIRILPPDVNGSEIDCAIDEGRIRLGLGAIKNVGKAAEIIIAAREAKGPFKSLFDLCERVDLRLVNKKCLESLVSGGALDSLKGTRAKLFAAIDRAVEYGNGRQRERESGQTSLFGVGEGAALIATPEPELPDVPAWPYHELLAKEKDVLNFYVSGHPLDKYKDEIRGFSSFTLNAEDLGRARNSQQVIVGGLITSFKTHIQKNGKQMAFCELEDFDGTVEMIVFAEPFEKFGHLLAPNVMIMVKGQISLREGETKPKIMADQILSLSEARERLARSVHIKVRTQGLESDLLRDISSDCLKTPGECSLIIHLHTQENNEYRIRSKKIKVNPAADTITGLRNRVGEQNVWLSRAAA